MRAPRLALPTAALALAACGDGASTGKGTDDTAVAGPTWHQDVAPIVAARCGACHGPEGISPLDLTDPAVATPLASAIVDAVDSGRMPPWLAQDTDECAPLRPWKDDLRLSDAEKATLRDWAAAGAPLGDPARAAALPTPPSVEIDAPSVELPFPDFYKVEGERDDFVCFVLDPGNTETRWVKGIQLLPGDERVAHHALIMQDIGADTEGMHDGSGMFPCFNTPNVNGFLMGTWTPGAVPTRMPEGVGMPLFPGARLVVQMHYHPIPGEPAFDQSTVQIEWTDEAPTYEAIEQLIGNDSRQNGDGSGLQPGPNDPPSGPAFLIPAGAQGHTEEIVFRQDFPIDLPVFAVGTHMHYVGTDMRIAVERGTPDAGEPKDECLIQTPAWDFNWQRIYAYDVPVADLPVIGQGDVLRLTCTYDNSLDNPFVRDALAEQGLDAPQDVRLGEETLDEMCLGLFGVVLAPGLVEQIFGE